MTCIAGRKRAFPAVLAGMFRGDHVRRREVSTFLAATLTVRDAGEVWSDGDLVGELPATITTRPCAATVRRPMTVRDLPFWCHGTLWAGR
ncbi:MAG: hypothetical protein IPK37_10480 [Austwickia sp.]|nr:MAG: hypothetical protein IPK37_10480 [Austwickia sp.]